MNNYTDILMSSAPIHKTIRSRTLSGKIQAYVEMTETNICYRFSKRHMLSLK